MVLDALRRVADERQDAAGTRAFRIEGAGRTPVATLKPAAESVPEPAIADRPSAIEPRTADRAM
jgi:hypothetical protein